MYRVQKIFSIISRKCPAPRAVLYHTYCTSVPRYRKPSEATLYCMAATMMFCSDASILEHENNAISENWRRIHKHTISLRFLGKILRALRLEVFTYNVYLTNQFQATFAQGGLGGGVKSVSRGDQEFGLWIILRDYRNTKKKFYDTEHNNLDYRVSHIYFSLSD